MIGAVYGEACGGCPQARTEAWVRGKLCWHCTAEGEHRGWIVGFGRPNPYIPAWCPRKEERHEKARAEAVGGLRRGETER